MKNLIVLTAALIAFNVRAQDMDSPSYLTEQAFPDSVMIFALTSSSGNTITWQEILDKHKGRKTVVDFWASWCPDCIKGLPSLNKLINRTSKSDVDYVFLSVDKDAQKWKNAIQKYNIVGEHYQITEGWKNPLTNYIDLDWIPRYIIIDESGNIELPKTVSAADKRMITVLKNKK